MKALRSPALALTGILLAAAAWKIFLIFSDVVPFNADEAVVGLMARHILNGERPIFFYGQAYMGSLDAYLVALGFLFLGQQVWVIRLVQGLLYLGVLLTTFALGRAALDSTRVGLLAAALMAIPTVNVTLYSTASLGGYGEALLIGNLILLVAFSFVRRWLPVHNRMAWAAVFAWGLLAGFGLWANGLTLVYSLPSGVYIAWAIWQRQRWLGLVRWMLLAGGGILLGALPWWLYALSAGSSSLILELLGSAVSVEKESWLVRTFMHLFNFLLLGASAMFGFRPPWKVEWLALPLLPFVLLFWLAVLLFWFGQVRKGHSLRLEYGVLLGVAAVLLAGFLFTAFGVDPSGRYFLPLTTPLALAASALIWKISKSNWQVAGLAGLLVVFHLWGTLQCVRQLPPGLTTQFDETTIIDHRADF